MHIENNEDNSIKEKLLCTGLKLFSKYGFDAASTRMIAKESGVIKSSIFFYFENKETYYNAVMERAMEVVNAYLDPIFNEISEAYDSGEVTFERAHCLIKKILNVQIAWYFSDEHADIVNLIVREQSSAILKEDIFHDSLYKKIVEPFSRLIKTVTGIKDNKIALMLCLYINGSIQSIGEHRSFTNRLFEFDSLPGNKKAFLDQLTKIAVQNTELILKCISEK
jgi:AcrR family transcriptional regulator